MEETRIGRMYASLLMRSVRNKFERTGRRGGPSLTIAVIAIALLLFWGLYSIRHSLHLSTLRDRIKQGPVRPEAPTPMPGGQEAIVITRGAALTGDLPELVSATLLPGRGMNLLQLTASIPGFGEVPLLLSPSLEDATAHLTGTGDDLRGALSMQMGAALEAPWAGRIAGAGGPDGNMPINWHGQRILLPAERQGRTELARDGMVLMRAAESSASSVMPDGGEAEAVFQAGDFEGHWLSQTEIKVKTLLSTRSLELTVIARNTGPQPEPIGIGWHPRFALRPGSRSQMMLKLPRGLRAEVGDRTTGLPTGRLLPTTNTAYDFSERTGKSLGSLTLDDTFVKLMPALLDNGPVAELRDPSRNFGIRLTALSTQIKAFRVDAPAGQDFISIEPQFNFDDPFGREWGTQDTGMYTLQPGQSVQWRVRLELFSLSPVDSGRGHGPSF